MILKKRKVIPFISVRLMSEAPETMDLVLFVCSLLILFGLV